ncbi:MAG: TIGR03960 family B12-binding radical SAM protein, partial [Myxococcota bacterium]
MSDLREFFLSVSRPLRYTGGEVNQIKKDFSDVRIRFLLAFPDIYEIGMSHTGGKIIYKLLNDQSDILCERVFAPWIDAREEMKRRGIKLFSLESRRSISDFDVVGFSVEYEMSFSTIVEMLGLGGIEPLSEKRDESSPLIIGGGPSLFNPEPMAGVFDIIYLGDAEENLLFLLRRYADLRERGLNKRGILERLSEIEGVYVPSLYDVKYEGLYLASAPDKVIRKATVRALSKEQFPTNQIVPLIETVQDRFVVEIQRGCTHGCRFCFAGYIYRPVRQRSRQDILNIVINGIKGSGFQEVSFLSLSAGDYDGVDKIFARVNEEFSSHKVSLSLPSLRVDTASREILNQISLVKRTGITIAPEAGSERMRRKINKNISEEEIIRAVDVAFETGWELIKLYFMIGLPDEGDEDIEAICNLSYRILDTAKKYKRRPDINITISPFVPKAHTPLQWERFADDEDLKRKISIIRDRLRHPAFKIKKTDISLSKIEALLSRGDRRVLDVILDANMKGSYLDAWSDNFDIRRYLDSSKWFYEKYNIQIEDYLKERDIRNILPWDIISTGISKEFLLREREAYQNEIETEDCLIEGNCSACGVCDSEFTNIKAKDELKIEKREAPHMSDGFEEITYYRLRYAKEGDMIYASHLDIMNIFNKALLMSGLPLHFRGAFNPRADISSGPALPIGVISTTEFMDFVLKRRYTVDLVMNTLSHLFPSGIRVIEMISSQTRFKSISQLIAAVRYDIFTNEIVEDGIIEKILNSKELKVIRKKDENIKEVDIRRFIYDIRKGSDGTMSIYLLYREEGTANIFEVLALLGIERKSNLTIRKDKVYFSLDEV